MRSRWRRKRTSGDRRRRSGGRLLILDDVFPNPLSGFRLTEFATYLEHFPDASVITTPHGFPAPSGQIGFEHSMEAGLKIYPGLAGRVSEATPDQPLPQADLAYLVFLNNGYAWIEALEAASLPFVVTIYPGGGTGIDDPTSDAKLHRVLGSPLCRAVITTQQVTDRYLRRGFVDADKVTYVFGVVPSHVDPDEPPRGLRRRYGVDKDRLDLVFAAHQYTADGADKGYDVVIDAMHRLVELTDDVDLHLVGPWDPPDEMFGARVRRHGLLSARDLRRLYWQCDAVLSPNRRSRLHPGAYDGFPLGTCVEAGLEGVAVLAANPTGETAFGDEGDVVRVIPADADGVVATVMELRARPKELARLGEKARVAFAEVYSLDAQMNPRLALLQHHLEAVQRR